MSTSLSPTERRAWPNSVVFALVLMVVVGLHALVYGAYLPSADGRIGHDYAYSFPNFLAGAYWFHQNGALSIPWFTPAFAGGLPFYAHPANGYVSFPQAAMIASGPVFAARATLVVFAALGFAGAFLCLRRTFALSFAAALFGATLFTWNGFFSARMLAGHIVFHSQMLVPLAAWLLARPVPLSSRVRGLAFDAVCAALIFAYMIQSGNVYGLVPAVLSCAVIALAAAWRGARLADSAIRLALALTIAVALCAAKLNAGIAFIESCPRVAYPLPGAFNEIGALALVVQSLFIFPSVDIGRGILVNEKFRLERHEWDFDITWVALVLILAALYVYRHRLRERVRGRRNIALVVSACVVLLVPVAVNVYRPGWHEVLKHVPIVQNSSNLVRWFMTYVPVFCIAAALCFDALTHRARRRTAFAVLACVAVITTHLLRDRSYYANQPYSATTIENAARELRETGRVPAIDRCDGAIATDKSAPWPADRNDHLATGESRIACYEPIFGYALEWFPLRTLHPGPAREVREGIYNFKNPASYVFPAENGLQPGEHFRVGQEAQLDALLGYRPFEFAVSPRQRTAELINVCAGVAVLVFLVACALWSLRRSVKT